MEREADEEVASPIKDSVVPERVDDEDARETSEATSQDPELPLLERKTRRQGKAIHMAMRKDEGSEARFMVVFGERDVKGETGDGFVDSVRDSIVPKRVYHDENEDATGKPANPNTELPLARERRGERRRERGRR